MRRLGKAFEGLEGLDDKFGQLEQKMSQLSAPSGENPEVGYLFSEFQSRRVQGADLRAHYQALSVTFFLAAAAFYAAIATVPVERKDFAAMAILAFVIGELVVTWFLCEILRDFIEIGVARNVALIRLKALKQDMPLALLASTQRNWIREGKLFLVPGVVLTVMGVIDFMAHNQPLQSLSWTALFLGLLLIVFSLPHFAAAKLESDRLDKMIATPPDVDSKAGVTTS